MSWKIWNYLRHHEQWFMNCLVRQFCLFTEISSIYNNKQTQSLLIFELQAKQGLRSNHIFTIESFWQNHPTYLIIFKYSSVPTEGMKILGIPTGLFIQVWHPLSSLSHFWVVYDRNHYFSLGPIPKPKLADTFGRYHNRYRNYILKGESSSR